mgnify:CR=1 FL=1
MIQLNIFTDRDSYASSKAIGEFYVKYYCQEYNVDYLILRPFSAHCTVKVFGHKTRVASDIRPFFISGGRFRLPDIRLEKTVLD